MSDSAPYPVDPKDPGEGRGVSQYAGGFWDKKRQNAVRFSFLGFKAECLWEKDKMLSVFRFQSSMVKCMD